MRTQLPPLLFALLIPSAAFAQPAPSTPTPPRSPAPARPAAPAPAAAPAPRTAAAGAATAAAPAAGAAAAPAAGAAPAAAAAAPAPAARSGVVLIEQQGRPVALGVVLHGDGRIVTASSRITPGQLFVRFEDNTSLAARVGHTDPAADLALLVPQSAKWQKGLKAERGPGKSDSFALFTSGANRKLEAQNVKVLGTGQTRKQPTLQLSASLKPTDLGGPILNEQGEVIAIAVNGCEAPVTTCKEAPVGLPIAAVRRFLAVRPAEAAFPVPVLGVTGSPVDTKVVRGLRLTAVEAKSPAAALKLRVDGEDQERDILVAVAGEPVTTPEELNTVLTRHTAGERVELLLFGVNGYRSVAVRLAPPATKPKPLPVPQLGL